MLNLILKKIFGSRNERLIKSMYKVVAEINAFEPKLGQLSDANLQAKTVEFKARLAQGESLNALLKEAFAVTREASKRVLGMRHFDVQLLGGMVLHQGKIAEMRTGEGKTLVATLPLYLNALTGKGAHLVTVNDYLAKRDAEQMAPLYAFLGLTTGVIVPGLSPEERKAAYAADITYGTNNEFGFDYLRDNMALALHDRVQRGLHFAVVDEVDSILIDEARTPLIISGTLEDSSHLYRALIKLVPKLERAPDKDAPGDYYLDEKAKQAFLTEAGHEHIERLLTEANLLKAEESLYSSGNISMMHYLNAVLRAHALFHRDVDYIVSEDQVVIIDPHTGRAMAGRRWSEGLHQALEAKENLPIQAENQTLASTTFQNYFRLYEKLAGMTGTADSEAYEFQQIYNLEVVVIPTHQPMIRKDHPDMVFMTLEEKFKAILAEIQACYAKGQPVLVGTASIETSEHLSHLLQQVNIPHEVLNAKQHAREATIIAEAGRPSAVTIATNMAGRGTDIILGGAQKDAEWDARHQAVIQTGGLYIIGSERHESRRIDNQLRGRSGRQGDPGMSRFYLSLQDNLVRIFGGERLAGMMRRLGMKEGDAIESHLVSKAIANAQKKVENHNFDIRKQLLQYDNVINDQRLVIYKERAALLENDNIADVIDHLFSEVFQVTVTRYLPSEAMVEQWDVSGLETVLRNDFMLTVPLNNWVHEDDQLDEKAIAATILALAQQQFAAKTAQVDPVSLKQFIKLILLQQLDQNWREHLAGLEHLRNSINLRGYAQRDPKQEYKREAFNLFSAMLDKFQYEVVVHLSKLVIKPVENPTQLEQSLKDKVHHLNYQHEELDGMGNQLKAEDQAAALDSRIGRNDLCPCGSGKKYKYCHGKLS